MKPPELKYGWRIGEEQFLSLICTHFQDAIRYSIGPELDDGNQLSPPEEYQHPRIWRDATIFGLPIVDSILRYLGMAITDMVYHPGKMLPETRYLKLKALISPNEDARWYLGFDNWQWRRQVPKKTSKPM